MITITITATGDSLFAINCAAKRALSKITQGHKQGKEQVYTAELEFNISDSPSGQIKQPNH